MCVCVCVCVCVSSKISSKSSDMGVHYAKRGATGGAIGEGKPAPPSLSKDLLKYIIALFRSVTVP